MRGQHHYARALDETLDPRFCLAHEVRIARQDPFVHQQYLRLEAGRHSKAKPQ